MGRTGPPGCSCPRRQHSGPLVAETVSSPLVRCRAGLVASVPAVEDGCAGSLGRMVGAAGLGILVPDCILPHILPVAFSLRFWVPPLVVLPCRAVLGFPIGRGVWLVA